MSSGKRVYLDAQAGDGQRALDEWRSEVAPSTELRKAFAHRVEAFDDFSAAYRRELAGSP